MFVVISDQASQFDREWKQRFAGGFSSYAHSASMPAIGSSRSHEYASISAPVPTGTVTIEELPPSDDEQTEDPLAFSSTSRHGTAATARAPSSRRTQAKDKRSKKRSKMY